MEYRYLGRSGFRVPVLSFGTGTFGGSGALFSAWGSTDVAQARRLIDICLEAGLNLFDSADVYSKGAAESILGEAIKGRPRDSLIISTKATFRFGDGENQGRLLALPPGQRGRCRAAAAGHRLHRPVPVARLRCAYAGGGGALHPRHLVRAGKIRYLGVSNFSGWHLMKSLATADRYGWSRYVAHRAYYSLVGRDYEWELMPLAEDQGVGAVVWSPLGWGRLTGKLRRGQPLPDTSRLQSQTAVDSGPQVPEELLYRVVDALDEVAAETGKSLPQVALNWLLQRPTVSSVIIGARNEEQLKQNLGAVGWNLSDEQVARLDAASAVPKTYPYWHQGRLQVPQSDAGGVTAARLVAGRDGFGPTAKPAAACRVRRRQSAHAACRSRTTPARCRHPRRYRARTAPKSGRRASAAGTWPRPGRSPARPSCRRSPAGAGRWPSSIPFGSLEAWQVHPQHRPLP